MVFVTNKPQSKIFSDNSKNIETTAKKTEEDNEVVDMAIDSTFTLSFGWSHTPGMCLFRSASAVLCRSPVRDWDVN